MGFQILKKYKVLLPLQILIDKYVSVVRPMVGTIKNQCR